MVINKFLGGVMNNSFCPLIERKDTTSKILCREAMKLIRHRKTKK
ncbi:[NiFe] hydrogenase, small subunit [Clostridium botulinum A1 str. CFSAN002368]|nr:[NiFe] hydrogenase, small subunit [Clostridium botulinum A1 str. CFSAN002368]